MSEPAAWFYQYPGETGIFMCADAEAVKGIEGKGYIITPLYTHPEKTLTEIIEKNKPEIEKVNAYIKSLEDEIKALKEKTLTDEEIKAVYGEYFDVENCDWLHLQCIQAILRKAQEK